MGLCGVKGLRCLGPNVYPVAPDGGWGWVVAVAFFLVEAFTYGSIKSFGIFIQDLMEEYGETNNRVSWIVSICVFVMTFAGPLSSVMTNRFGFQAVVMSGGLLISVGVITTSFTTSITQMYITYGLVAGLGYCLTFLPTVTILSQYFTRRRSLVTSVASIGESLFIFAMAPAFSALSERHGWRKSLAVMGALQSTIVVCGALLRPIILKPTASRESETATSSKELEVLGAAESAESTKPDESLTNRASPALQTANCSEERTLLHREGASESEQRFVENSEAAIHVPESEEEIRNKDADKQDMKDEVNKPRNSKLLDFSILRECNFFFYCMFGLFATLGFFAPQLYIIELSVSRGMERDHATYMLSTMAVAEILGRFSIGWIMTHRVFRKRKLFVLLACVISMTLDLVGFTLVTNFYGLAVCCAVYGFFMGTVACTHIPLLAEDDVVGIDRMSSAAGVYVCIHSFAGLAGPPLGGVLVDVTQNYGSAFYSCAAGMAVGAVFLCLVKPAKKGLLCRKGNPWPAEEVHAGNADSVEHKPDSSHAGSDAEIKTQDDQEVIRFA